MSVKSQLSFLKTVLYLTAVIHNGQIRQTAEENGIKASNLSRMIKELEGALGTRLLIRKSTGVEPTAAGLQICEMVQGLETKLERLEEIRLACERPDEVILRLPASFKIAGLEDFSKKYPTLQLKQTEQATAYRVGLFYEKPEAVHDKICVPFTFKTNDIEQRLWIVYKETDRNACLLFDFIVDRLRL